MMCAVASAVRIKATQIPIAVPSEWQQKQMIQDWVALS